MSRTQLVFEQFGGLKERRFLPFGETLTRRLESINRSTGTSPSPTAAVSQLRRQPSDCTVRPVAQKVQVARTRATARWSASTVLSRSQFAEMITELRGARN